MQVTDQTVASAPELVARRRSAVERLLSLSGAIPLPVFLLLHLAREASFARADDVAEAVREAAGALAFATSLCLVWAPLLVHLGLAGWLALSPRRRLPPPAGVVDVPALAVAVSRASSVLALGFLFYHAQELPLSVWLGDVHPSDTGMRLVGRLSATSFGVPLAGGAYLIGLLATVVHAGLGVQRALLAEGVLFSAERRRRSAQLCGAAAALTFALGAFSIIRVATGTLWRS